MDNMRMLEEQLPLADDSAPLKVQGDDSSSYAHRLRALAQHNARQPVCSLPPEILSKIFRHLREISYSDRVPWPRTEDTPEWRYIYPWIAATHVCRYFRSVGLGDADLWSMVTAVCSHYRWAVELLKRSKDASISLDIHLLFPLKPSLESDYALFVKQLSEPSNICRTRRIKADNSVPPTRGCPYFHELFKHPAPLLQSLQLCNSEPPYTMVTLPSTWGKSYAPRLREVILSGCSFSWTSFALPLLTCLDIWGDISLVNVPSSGDGITLSKTLTNRMLANALIDCLRGLPLLEVLRLGRVLPNVTLAESLGTTTPISLPNLKTFELVDSVLSCSWLLNSIDLSFPLEKLLICPIIDVEIDDTNLQGLLRFLSSYTPYLTINGPINELAIRLGDEVLFIRVVPQARPSAPEESLMEEGVHGTSPSEKAHDFSISFEYLSLDPADSFVDRYSFAHIVLKALPLSHPKLLTLTAWRYNATYVDLAPLDPDFWYEFYDACGPANNIQLTNGAAIFLSIFAIHHGPHRAEEPQAVAETRPTLFPAIKSLTIEGIGSGRLEDVLSTCIDEYTTLELAANKSELLEYLSALQVQHVQFVYECLASRASIPEVTFLEHLELRAEITQKPSYLDSECRELLLSTADNVDFGEYASGSGKCSLYTSSSCGSSVQEDSDG